MKAFGALVFAMFVHYAEADISAFAITTDSPSQLIIFVNGTLFNKEPKSHVRVSSRPGLFHLEVHVLNPYDKRWYAVRKDIIVSDGLEFFYKVDFNKFHAPEIHEVRHYPLYSKFYIHRELYSYHPIS